MFPSIRGICYSLISKRSGQYKLEYRLFYKQYFLNVIRINVYRY
nr:MAG TPA: hypothetical protein [Caudoviricetes sp.]